MRKGREALQKPGRVGPGLKKKGGGTICGSSILNPACDQATISAVSLPGQEGNPEDKQKGYGSPGLQVGVAEMAVTQAGRGKGGGRIWRCAHAQGLLGLCSPNIKLFQNRAVQMGTKGHLEAGEVVKLETRESCSQIWRLRQQPGR